MNKDMKNTSHTKKLRKIEHSSIENWSYIIAVIIK